MTDAVFVDVIHKNIIKGDKEMSEIGLKIQIGNTNIELTGEAEIVKNIFNDIRENGLGKINVNP